MPLILPGNVASATASTTFSVANSCRFNDGDTASMAKSNGGSGNQRTYTMSAWVKFGLTPPASRLFSIGDDASNTIMSVFITSGDLRYEDAQSGANYIDFRTDAIFRDPSAWQHFAIMVDTTQGTEGNRVKIYHNGTQITSFSSSTYPDQNYDTLMNHTTGDMTVGARAASPSGSYFDGYLAEVVVLDGTAAAIGDLGEFDEDSPTIWKPKDVSGLTFGTNGFYLDFEDSSNLGNDANGGTDFTESNLAATDQGTDSPTNNFATLNPLWVPTTSGTEEANLTLSDPASGWSWKPATIMPSAGKWYAEFKSGNGSDPIYTNFGVVPYASFPYIEDETIGAGSSSEAESVGYDKGGTVIKGDSTQYSGTSYGYDDIVCIAVDLDNRAVYFRKNGSAWENSGDPTSGASKTGAVALSSTLSDWSICPSSTQKVHCNYGGGCAYAISSGNADGNGYGNFEYAPPSGYLALCTKNLGSDGG